MGRTLDREVLACLVPPVLSQVRSEQDAVQFLTALPEIGHATGYFLDSQLPLEESGVLLPVCRPSHRISDECHDVSLLIQFHSDLQDPSN